MRRELRLALESTAPDCPLCGGGDGVRACGVCVDCEYWALEFARDHTLTPWEAVEARRQMVQGLVEVCHYSWADARGVAAEALAHCQDLAQSHNVTTRQALEIVWGIRPRPGSREAAWDKLGESFRALLASILEAVGR